MMITRKISAELDLPVRDQIELEALELLLRLPRRCRRRVIGVARLYDEFLAGVLSDDHDPKRARGG
jgi:hypothetical protein